MITERILQLLDYKKITPYRFCTDLGYSHSFLNKKREIGTDKYANILKYFSDVSPEWLLTGEGEILKNSDKSIEFELNFYKNENISLKEEQKRLLRIIENLTSKDEKNVLSLESA